MEKENRSNIQDERDEDQKTPPSGKKNLATEPILMARPAVQAQVAASTRGQGAKLNAGASNERRSSAHDEDGPAFNENYACTLRGNYLLSLGYPGSGKTTLQFMLTWMMHGLADGYKTSFNSMVDIVPPRSMNESEVHHAQASAQRMLNLSQSLLNDWSRRFQIGQLPEPTVAGEREVRDMRIRVKPKRRGAPELDFNFIEISGENLEDVIAGDGEPGSLPKGLEAFLENRNINLIISVLVSPTVIEQNSGLLRSNDILLRNMMAWAEARQINLEERASLLIIIPNPAAAMKHLAMQTGMTHVPNYSAENIATYLKDVAPYISNIVDNWDPKRSAISKLFIGNIDEEELNNEKIIRIQRPVFYDIENIFKWMYKQYTGFDLNRKTLIERLFGR